MEYKYWIAPPLLVVIIFIIYYYKTNKTNNKNIETNEPPIIKFIKSENQDKQLQLLITSMIKYIQKQDTTSKYLVDSINKSSLFNKDIVTKRILIDTNCLKKQESFTHGNYVYDFTDKSLFTDNTVCIGNIKNVIGFRLIKSIIPNKLFAISDRNNKLCIKYKNTAIQIIKLLKGMYVSDLLFQCFPEQTKGHVNISTQYPDNISTSNKPTMYENRLELECTESFQLINDIETLKKNYSDSDIKIIQNTAKTFGYTYNKTYSSKSTSRKPISRYNPTDSQSEDEDMCELISTESINYISADAPPNLLVEYIDLVVNEIPPIACTINHLGKRIIDRIPLTNPDGLNYIYQPNLNYKINYFSPITLDKLTIELYEPGFFPYYNPENSDHVFEFEITYIHNEKNVGLIGPNK